MNHLARPYLLFLGDSPYVKTAAGVRDWCPQDCVGQFRFDGAPADLGLPDMTFEQAFMAGARTVILGGAPPGGRLPAHWVDALEQALEAGLDIANGLHDRLNEHPVLAPLARRLERTLWDIRHVRRSFEIGQFEPRPGRRVLTVGTDCVVGKKYTALALAKALREAGLDADFRATGQTGALIAGEGFPIDSVLADFVSSAAVEISPAAAPDHWDVIEGQGSLFHPAYASVTLGLIHGSQPDFMVLCTDPTRTRIAAFEHYSAPALDVCIARYEEAAQLTNPNARVVGVSMNTSAFSQDEARALLERTAQQLEMPCIDPIRDGVDEVAELLIKSRLEALSH